MKIHIHDIFQLSTAGTVAGKIWFSDDEWCFPCVEYSDFPFRCILSWLDTLCDCLNDCKTKSFGHYSLLFFDGPYLLTIEKTMPFPQLCITFYDGVSIQGGSIVGDTAVMSKNIDLIEFINMILEAGRKLVDISRYYNLNCSDLSTKIASLSSQCQSFVMENRILR